LSLGNAPCATVPLTGSVRGYWSDGHGVFERYSTMGIERQDAHSRDFTRTGLSCNTIRKYLRDEIVEPRFQTPTRLSKQDPFAEKLSGWLVKEQRKTRTERHTAKQMHADLVKLGFDRSYERVAALVRAWKEGPQRALLSDNHLGRGGICAAGVPAWRGIPARLERALGQCWATRASSCRSPKSSCRIVGCF